MTKWGIALKPLLALNEVIQDESESCYAVGSFQFIIQDLEINISSRWINHWLDHIYPIGKSIPLQVLPSFLLLITIFFNSFHLHSKLLRSILTHTIRMIKIDRSCNCRRKVSRFEFRQENLPECYNTCAP